MASSPEDKDGVKKAFLLLGKEATVKSRNHWATYEREFEKVQELKRVLSTPGQNGHAQKPHAPAAIQGNGHHAAPAPQGNGHHAPAPYGANGNHGLPGTNGSARAPEGAHLHNH